MQVNVMPSVRNNFAVIALALGVAVAALPVQAQNPYRKTLSIGEYHEILNDPNSTLQENRNIIGWYLIGLVGGFDYLETSFYRAGAKRLYCPPQGALDGSDRYNDLIAREMKRRPDLWRKDSPQPLARLVIAAMRYEFPCR
jgi:hypothetical protein